MVSVLCDELDSIFRFAIPNTCSTSVTGLYLLAVTFKVPAYCVTQSVIVNLKYFGVAL
jgi:hypothetical protein